MSPRLLAALLLLLHAAPAAAGNVHRYTVSVDPALSRMEVSACFGDAPPAALVADDDAVARLQRWRIAGGPDQALTQEARLPLPQQPGVCVDYTVGLEAGRRWQDDDAPRRIGRDLLLPVELWLWRARRLPAGTTMEIEFRLPPGIEASGPWPEQAREPGRVHYAAGRSPREWPALLALGRFTQQDVEVAGGRLRLAVLDGSPALDPGAARRWIERIAGTLAAVHGRFPQPDTQVLVIPVGASSEALPWAQVLRGGAPSVQLFVDQTRPPQQLLADWTAWHEFSHLLLPFVRRGDAWLSEGLATYYQNLLRARAGAITPEQAWQSLHRGFQRGRRAVQGDTLATASENMLQDRRFQRVYWSGAAMMLQADLRLRGAGSSLDAALGALARCCLPSERAWSAREVVQRMEREAGTPGLWAMLAAEVDGTGFPELSGAYRTLGLEGGAHGVALQPDPAASALRAAIMAPAAR